MSDALRADLGNRDIIVIGGSSGATNPLKSILARLPADLPAAVFIVLHIPARSTGILATVASAAGLLPVQEVEDGMEIRPGCVYIAAPDHHMLLSENHIRLGCGPRENMVRPAIDPLFRSAAIAYGPRVIGVVLSGLLSDGASGLNAIKRCGGFALVQDPSDAIADEMPRRAMEGTTVDLSVPAAMLGDVLCDLARESATGPILPIPPELKLEVDIAAGERVDSPKLGQIGSPSPLTCPSCMGVLNEVSGPPLRYRCQVGHAYTADVLATEQEGRVDEALRVALRIIEERAELVTRMAEDGRLSGRRAVAEMYGDRAREYRNHANTIREAVLNAAAPAPQEKPAE